jgi:hypothetical protein
MPPVLVALAMFVLAFAIPYHAPRLGLAAGVLGMGLSVAMILRAPNLELDFDMTRPLGIALGLYALIWVSISAVQLTRLPTTAR